MEFTQFYRELSGRVERNMKNDPLYKDHDMHNIATRLWHELNPSEKIEFVEKATSEMMNVYTILVTEALRAGSKRGRDNLVKQIQLLGDEVL